MHATSASLPLYGEKRGFNGALWNVKVFDGIEDSAPQQWIGLNGMDWNGTEWRNNLGQLGGSFRLLQGHVESKRIDGHDAIVLSPGTKLVYESALIDPKKPHTLSALSFDGKEWRAADLGKCISDGRLTIESGQSPLTLTNLRYYNWEPYRQ